MGVGNIVVKDRQSVENGMLPEHMADQQADLLTTLDIFQDRYFASIEVVIDPASGRKSALFCVQSEEEIKRQQAAKESKAANEAQQMSKGDC